MTQKDEAAAIAESLMAKTADKELTWSDSFESDEYSAQTARFLYYIKSRDEDGQPPYRLQVMLKGGDSASVVLEVMSNSDDAALGVAFRGLYEAAKRSYLGLTDSIANEVLRDLGDL